MRQAHQELLALLEPAINALGCELVGLDLLPQGKRSLLRIYIDKENGVTIDDCSAVSHQVSGVLDVEDPIREQYTLEVSSPGLNRPLFKLEQFERFIGHWVKLRLYIAFEGRRNFTGRIVTVEDDAVQIEMDGEPFTFTVEDIDKAHLVPDE